MRWGAPSKLRLGGSFSWTSFHQDEYLVAFSSAQNAERARQRVVYLTKICGSRGLAQAPNY
jgi:hypothetical protein